MMGRNSLIMLNANAKNSFSLTWCSAAHMCAYVCCEHPIRNNFYLQFYVGSWDMRSQRKPECIKQFTDGELWLLLVLPVSVRNLSDRIRAGFSLLCRWRWVWWRLGKIWILFHCSGNNDGYASDSMVLSLGIFDKLIEWSDFSDSWAVSVRKF